MFEIVETQLDGCLELLPVIQEDSRGGFVKTLHRGFFSDHNLCSDFAEEYYSWSARGVIRGMHFQIPPADHTKLVYCVRGAVLDVILDIRKGSPTYGKISSVVLDDQKRNIIYIPNGFAHGFCVLTETAMMLYRVSSMYSPKCDCGVLWNSFGMEWPFDDPMLSERDRALPPLDKLPDYFTWQGNNER